MDLLWQKNGDLRQQALYSTPIVVSERLYTISCFLFFSYLLDNRGLLELIDLFVHASKDRQQYTILLYNRCLAGIYISMHKTLTNFKITVSVYSCTWCTILAIVHIFLE